MDRRFRWAAVLAALLIAVGVGVISYNAGVSHGLAIGASSSGASVPAPFGPYGWYRPWGFGFFGPFVFVLFWFLVFRLLFWGGFYRNRWYYRGRYDFPSSFDEWHRRAHERLNGQAKSPTQGNA
jgi:ABC-type Fe3+ transport system permease subunit